MLELLAHLALRGALRVLDGGNSFNVYQCGLAIGRLLGGQTANLPVILERISLARAFTCYQMETLLKETPTQTVPTLVLDLLSTFYDESVAASESRRLLHRCLLHLKRLNRMAPVAISAYPASNGSRPELLQDLRATAHQTWELEEPVLLSPTRLF